jgi:hypothetical protein
LVETADHGDPEADLLAVGVDGEVHRIDDSVDDIAEQIADRGRANDRDK